MLTIVPFIIRTACLFSLWVILSGKMDAVHLGIGLFCAFFVSFFSFSLAPAQKRVPLHLLPLTFFKAIYYGCWLMSRIFLAAIHISKVILNPQLPLKAGFIHHKTKLKSDAEKVIFANSITLTPGTITAEVNGDEFVIHQMDDDSAGDILTGLMEDHIQKIFPERKS